MNIYVAEMSKDSSGHIFGVNKFGWSPDCDTASRQVVWDGGAVPKTYTFLTEASTLYLSSSAAGDDQVYEVQGLDANWAMQTKEVTCNGKAFVAIAGTWMRVFRVKNKGTTDNAGDIYVSSSNTDAGGDGIPDTTSAIKAKITAGNNQTLMAIYTIPAGYTGYLEKWYASCGKAEDMEATLWARLYGSVFQMKDHQLTYQTPIERTYYPQPYYLEKTDLYIMCEMISNGSKEVSAGFDLILKKN